ncbi:HCP-like protein, partial [Backusella circina FSU 941]
MYKRGFGVIKDYQKAMDWHLRAASNGNLEALKNDPKTIFHIASIYYNYKKNSSKAFAWFYKAALQNYGQAQFQVGLMHQYGEGVTQDYEMAMQWYQKAAKFENLDAMNYIAYLYRYGLGVAANLHTSIEWYTKAAIHGYTLAHYNLGYIYETKNEVKDLQKAIHWYKKAADKGHCIAEMQL